MRTLTDIIEPIYDGCTVSDVLHKKWLASDGLCSRLKRRSGSVLLNGEPVYLARHVSAGDVLTVCVGDPEKDHRIRPKTFPLSILYEDDDLLIVDKPNGLAVHPVRDETEPTLENALAAYLTGTDNPHPVSRLDRGTTGLLTVAKSGWAHSWMKALQHADGMQKTYLAISEGVPSPARGMIDVPIGFANGSRLKRAVTPDGQPAKTGYEVIQVQNDLALVRLCPRTGRTHQIRVHMASIGCPLLGDWLYGKRDGRIDRPALHASELQFLHPLTGHDMHFYAPLPDDMQCLFPKQE